MPKTFAIREDFKKTYDESLGSTILPLCKSYTCKIKKSDNPKVDVQFIISTNSPDRDRDTIAVDGWNLKNFKKNPVVLWSHDYSMPPIGKARGLKVLENDLLATVKFVPAEVFPFAGMIESMVREEFLSATSVGFQGEEVTFDEKRGGFNFLKQELLEFSIVPVPANPEALVQAKSCGIDIGPMVRWAETLMIENLEYVEDESVYDATWLKWLSENIKTVNKKTVSVDLDLMEKKGTIFEEPVGAVHPQAEISFSKEEMAELLAAALQKSAKEKQEDKEKKEEDIDEGTEDLDGLNEDTEDSIELELPEEAETIVEVLEDPVCLEMECDELAHHHERQFTQEFVDGLLVDIKKQTESSLLQQFEQLDLEAIVAKAFRMQRGRLD